MHRAKLWEEKQLYNKEKAGTPVPGCILARYHLTLSSHRPFLLCLFLPTNKNKFRNFSSPTKPRNFPQTYTLKEDDSLNGMLLVRNKNPKRLLGDAKGQTCFSEEGHGRYLVVTSLQLRAQTSARQSVITSTLSRQPHQTGKSLGPQVAPGQPISSAHPLTLYPHVSAQRCTGPLRRATEKTSVTHPTLTGPTVDERITVAYLLCPWHVSSSTEHQQFQECESK